MWWNLPSPLKPPNDLANESTLFGAVSASARTSSYARKESCIKWQVRLHTWTPSGLMAMNLSKLFSFTANTSCGVGTHVCSLDIASAFS